MWMSVVWMLVKVAAVVALLRAGASALKRCTRRSQLAAILALACALRIGWAVAVAPALSGDATWYHQRAAAIAAGQGYTIDGRPTARLAPGFPSALAVVYLVTGPHPAAGVVLNVVLSLAVIALTQRIARQIFDNDIALTAGLIAAIWPGQIPYAATLLSEPFFGVVFLLGYSLSLRAPEGRSAARRWLGAGACLAAATLTRPVTLLIAPVVAFLSWASGVRPGRAIAGGIVVAAVTAALVLPWGFRNYQAFGSFVPVTTSAGIALWEGNHPGSTGLPSDASVEPYGHIANEAERDGLAARDARAFMRADPMRAIRLYVEKLYRTYETDTEVAASSISAGRPWPPWLGGTYQKLCTTWFNVLMLLFCAFLFLPLAPRFGVTWWSWLLLVVPVVYFAGFQAVFISQYRYNYPALPFITIGAAVAIVRLSDVVRRTTPA